MTSRLNKWDFRSPKAMWHAPMCKGVNQGVFSSQTMSNHLWNHKIHQTLAQKGDFKDREWCHRPPTKTSSILCAQEIRGALPSLWDSSPHECHNDQYYSNQAHMSIVQGSENVRDTLWGLWVTKWPTSLHHMCHSPTIRHNVPGTSPRLPWRTMSRASKKSQSIKHG
jgi:hypothetical protein